MKPILVTIKETEVFTGQEWERTDYICPACKRIILPGDAYCKRCGEKLDWDCNGCFGASMGDCGACERRKGK